MISGLVAQILLFLLAAAMVGFLAGWFLGRQREAELLAELSKQRGLEERLAGRISQALDGLVRPLGSGEPKAGEPRGETTAVTEVRDEVVGLKSLLEGLRGGQADVAARLSSLANGLVTIQSMRTEVDLRPLEHRLETLGAEVQRSLTPDFAWVKEDVGGVKRDVTELRSAVDALKVGQLSGLQNQVQALRGVVEPIASGELMVLSARLEEVSRDVVLVKTGVDVAGQRLAELATRDLAGVTEHLGALEAAMAADSSRVQHRIEELGARVEVAPVISEIGGMSQGIGVLRGEVAAFREAIGALKEGQGVLGARLMDELEGAKPAVASLAGSVELLRGAVERPRMDLVPLEAKVEELAGSVESLRGTVERPRMDLVPLEGKVGELAGSVESLRGAVERPRLDLAPLEARVEELTENVKSLRGTVAGPRVDLAPLEAKVEELAGSVDSLRAVASPSVAAVESLLAVVNRSAAELAMVSSRMEGPVSSVAARLEELRETVEGLRSAAQRTLPSVDLSPLEGMVRGLVRSVAALGQGPERGTADLSPLRAQVDGLEARVELIRSERSRPLNSPEAPRPDPPSPAARASRDKSASPGQTAKKARPRR